MGCCRTAPATAPFRVFTRTRGNGTYPKGLGVTRAAFCLPPRARRNACALLPELEEAITPPAEPPVRALCAVSLFRVQAEKRSPEVAADATGRSGGASCAELETASISESARRGAFREPSLAPPRCPFVLLYIRLSRDGVRFREVTNCSGRRVDVCAGFRTDVGSGEAPLEKTSASNSLCASDFASCFLRRGCGTRWAICRDCMRG
jgi:hypothetical protein